MHVIANEAMTETDLTRPFLFGPHDHPRCLLGARAAFMSLLYQILQKPHDRLWVGQLNTASHGAVIGVAVNIARASDNVHGAWADCDNRVIPMCNLGVSPSDLALSV